MDSIWFTLLFVYLIGLAVEFIYLTKLDQNQDMESSFARDCGNIIESALWPVLIPCGVLFVIIAYIFDTVLKVILLIHSILRRIHGR